MPAASGKIIDYRDLIESSTRDFVGRQWVRDAVDAFLEQDGPRHFLLLGEPGCGKTAFMADLVRARGYAHHFVGKGSQLGVSSSAAWRDPVTFAESVGYQLLRDYGAWIMDWESWGIHVSQSVRELDGRLVGSQLERLDAVPRPSDRPLISVTQEVERFGAAAHVIGVYVEQMVMDVEQIVAALLTRPLRNIATRWPEHRLVIVLDGLDEAEGQSNPRRNILTMLPGAELPPNVRFLLASRPGEHLTHDFLAQAHVFWLSEDTAGNRDARALHDASDYVSRLAAAEPVSEMIARRGLARETLAERVAHASQGNFLYLHHYAEGLRSGYEDLLDLDALPEGLYGIYSDFLHRVKQRREDVSWDGAYKPMLGALAIAREPLTAREIAEFTGVKPATAGTVITRLKQFLDATKSGPLWRYAIYHSSFGEYLVSEENEDHIDAREAHAQIVEHYRRRSDGDWPAHAGEAYLRCQLAAHLAGAGLDEELWALIDRRWWMARLEGDSYTQNGFLADIDWAWRSRIARSGTQLPVLVRLQAARLTVSHQVSAYGDTELQALVWLERRPEAVAHARLRSGPGDRCRGLLAIFEAVRERSGAEIAILEEAADAAVTIEDRSARDHFVGLIVLALAENGNSERAAALAEHIEVERYRVAALLQAAHVSDEPDCVEMLIARAHETVRAISESLPVAISEGFVNVAKAMADLRVGDPVRVCDEALERTSGEDRELAITLTRLGQHERATRLIERSYTAWDRSQIKHAVALARTAMGVHGAGALFDEALADARESSSALAMRDVAQALASARMYEKAEAAARETPEVSAREESFVALANALTDDGEFEQAAKLAAEVTNELWRGNVYFRLAAALIDRGSFGEAVEIIGAIPRPETKAGACLRLAEAAGPEPVAGVDDPFGLAIDAARGIESPHPISALRDRAHAQTRVAVALARRGDRRAEATFQEATESAVRNPDEEIAAVSIRDLGSALCRLGQCARAVELARTVQYPEFRSIVLTDLVAVMAEMGSYEEGSKAARLIPDARYRSTALGRLALASARDDPEGASPLLDEAIATAISVKDPEAWVMTLLDLAFAVSHAAGELGGSLFDEALAACGDIEGQQPRANALHRLALALANAGNADRAVDVTDMVGDGWERDRVLYGVTVNLIRAGRIDSALRLSERIDYGYYQADVLRDVTSALIRDGDLEQAAVIAEAIPDDYKRNSELGSLVRALVDRGEFDSADRVARTIDDGFSRTYALEDLGRGYARAGREALAARLVDDIEQGEMRGRVMGKVVEGLVARGAFQDAERWALRIEGPEQRRSALHALAAGLARAGRYEHAAAVARSIPQPSTRASALMDIAVAMAEAEDLRADEYFDESLQAALADSEPSGWTLKEMAVARARAGTPTKALEVVEVIASEGSQAEALLAIAVVLAGAGDERAMPTFERGRALARGQRYSSPTMDFRELAAALSARGHFHDALNIIRQIRADNRGYVIRLDTLDVWAQAVAQSGTDTDVHRFIADHSRASLEAPWSSDDVDERIFREQTLHRLAVALGREARCELALTALQAVWGADDRAAASRETAAAMAQAGQFGDALMTMGAAGIEDYLQTLCRWLAGLENVPAGDALDALREACAVAGWVRPEFHRIVGVLSAASS